MTRKTITPEELQLVLKQHEKWLFSPTVSSGNWNRLRACLKSTDLSGLNLRGVDLQRSDLSDADLSNADLRGACLSNTDLRGADLRSADLSNANLSNANLSGADLSRATLSNAVLFGADLSGADLRSADLSNADLSNANLSGANLSNANLWNADLSNADLRGADRSGAEARGARFDGAKGFQTGADDSPSSPTPAPEEPATNEEPASADRPCAWVEASISLTDGAVKITVRHGNTADPQLVECVLVQAARQLELQAPRPELKATSRKPNRWARDPIRALRRALRLRRFRAGDRLFHHPSQEEKHAACDQEGHFVFVYGSPKSVLASDCTLLVPATNDQRGWILGGAGVLAADPNDPRAVVARRQYDAIGQYLDVASPTKEEK